MTRKPHKTTRRPPASARRGTRSARPSKPGRRSPAAVGPPRDFKGYGRNPPDPRWPGGARIAVNINLNFEAGGEHCLLEGDDRSEDALNDIGLPAYHGVRSPVVESVFEYGPRSGCWRLLRIFKRFGMKISILGVVRALELSPELTRAFMADGHEILSHGYRWLDYNDIDEKTEREHIRLGVETIRRLTGEAPVGWFNGRPSINTRRLLVEHGGFLYDRDYLGDELPFWTRFGKDTTSSSRPPSRPTTTASTAIWVSALPMASPAT
jgi:peptidoglycan/xylan/chitin deacetylase (PgdA/CDA1 family)